MIDSGENRRHSVICIHVSILPRTSLPSRLRQHFLIFSFASLSPGIWGDREFSLVETQMPTSSGSIQFSREFSNLLPERWLAGFQGFRIPWGKGLVLAAGDMCRVLLHLRSSASSFLDGYTCFAVWGGKGNLGFACFLGMLLPFQLHVSLLIL